MQLIIQVEKEKNPDQEGKHIKDLYVHILLLSVLSALKKHIIFVLTFLNL